MTADDLTQTRDLAFPGNRRARIAVGLLWQETNCFNPLPTTADDFVVREGAAVIDAYGHSATSLGGIIRRLDQLGAEAVPTLAAKARPGGPILDEVVEDLVGRLIEHVAAAGAEAVCLELHGSMVGTSIDDVEGMLLQRLRRRLGPAIPIVAALDLHGHLTAEMVAASDFLTAYRTQPHADMAETGERAASVLAGIMRHGVRPVAARRSLPFLALARDETHEPPMRAVLAAADIAKAQAGAKFLDLSIFNVHPFLDVPGIGQVVLAYADGDIGVASRVADRVADKLDAIKADFSGASDTLPDIFAQIAASRAEGALCAIGDQGDSVLAGTPGDSLDIARYGGTHHPALRGLIPVFDPHAVDRACAAGVGATIAIKLGASISPGLEPLGVEVRVERLTDGSFANEGAYMTGLLNELGPCAVLRQGRQVFLATTRAPSACDPALASHAGYGLDDFDYVVLKSGNHFKLSFAPPCRCHVAATAGLASRNPAFLQHRRARPLYPLDGGALDRRDP